MEALVIMFIIKNLVLFPGNKNIFDDKLKLFGSLRFDYNPEFEPKFTPRLAAVYTLNENAQFPFYLSSKDIVSLHCLKHYLM